MPISKERVKALVLAGGLGTRLRPLTDTTPKCLIPIADRPLLDYWIDHLVHARIHEARINNHAHADQVRAYISRPEVQNRVHLTETYEPVLLGSAGTISANADLAEDADLIVIIYADNLSDVHLPSLLDFHRSHGDPFTMLLFRATNPRACGIAEVEADGRIRAFVEKPENPVSDLANAGLYVLDAEAYREIAALRAFDIGFDVIPKFVGRMRGWAWGGYHLDVGTHLALAQARTDAPRVFPRWHPQRSSGSRPAVFLDRDGTLIEHVHYLSSPSEVRLLPGAAEAVIQLRRAGYRCVLVTNQSAVGRGIISEATLHEIHVEMNRQLAERGAALDGIYYCTDVPNGDDREVVENQDRKPGPGMLLRAASDLNLTLGHSWMIGDMISDVLAGWNAGCQSLMVASGQVSHPLGEGESMSRRYSVVPDLAAAAKRILETQGA